MLLALSVISEADAKHCLAECQDIELQQVQVLIPTTNILSGHCKVELIELHPSDKREELLQQEGIHVRIMTPHHQENYVAASHPSSYGEVPLMSM